MKYILKGMKMREKRSILKKLTGKWVYVKTGYKSFRAKGKLLGFAPESPTFIYVGTQLVSGSKNQFILTETVKILIIEEIRVYARKPKLK